MLQEQRIYQLQTKHRETQADLEQKPGQLQPLQQYLVARQSAAGSMPRATRQEMTQSSRSGKFPHFWKVRQMITKPVFPSLKESAAFLLISVNELKIKIGMPPADLRAWRGCEGRMGVCGIDEG